MDNQMIYAAPLQGYTDAEWRLAHNDIYAKAGGNADRYFTPFIRMEKGAVRTRDIRDLKASLNDKDSRTSAQIIFRDLDEFRRLTDTLTAEGCTAIDLNLGCPFPMQTKRGMGAAAVERPELLAEVSEEMKRRPEIQWSAKMRLGLTDPTAWRTGMGPEPKKPAKDILNDMPLQWLTVHPRVAAQGYKGEMILDEFDEAVREIKHPIIFNGDLKTPGDLKTVTDRWPQLAGVMTGRGLLERPSLIAEYRTGEEWSHNRRLEYIKRMHRLIFDSYSDRLEGGEHQLLLKLLSFWEHLEEEIGHKQFKAIKKAQKRETYLNIIKGMG